MSIKVIEGSCNGCEACVPVCPYGAISVQDGIARIDLDNCNLCGACVPECPFEAIVIEKETSHLHPPSDYHRVLVYGERTRNGIHRVVYELLSKGRELADKLNTELAVALVVDKEFPTRDEIIDGIIARGADTVYIVKNKTFKEFLIEPYTDALAYLIEKYKPEIVLAGATSEGRSLLPRVAARLKTGLTADCTGLDINEDGFLVQTRPAFGGNIMARIICEHRRPQMATVRYKVMEEAIEQKRNGEVVIEEFVPKASRTELLKDVLDETQKINLEDADVIVSGGRGIQDAKNFTLLQEFADLLGAALGSSRPPVDDGWIPYSHQVGQTGKTVRPKVYIACGISGSIQHLAGMSSSDYIIAINKDPDAPIFKVADLGIVGDLFEVIPELIKRLKVESR
ncbi:MAG: electron transfer flavoprotein subunit alpha [candidate division WOR-3 bacterium]|nr:electron transfer flavoprotein subunit alpha [candidate division WOR-3 bacterium]